MAEMRVENTKDDGISDSERKTILALQRLFTREKQTRKRTEAVAKYTAQSDHARIPTASRSHLRSYTRYNTPGGGISLKMESAPPQSSEPKPLGVAFLGPMGTYSHQAVVDYFGESAPMALYPEPTISAAYAALLDASRMEIGFAVLPWENSSAGPVQETRQLLSASQGSNASSTAPGGVAVETEKLGEIRVKVEHWVVRRRKSRRRRDSPVRTIISHEQALAQCSQNLARLFPTASLQATTSTAHAARLAAADEDGATAAICSKVAAQLFVDEVEVVERGVQDAGTDNETKFVVLAKKQRMGKP